MDIRKFWVRSISVHASRHAYLRSGKVSHELEQRTKTERVKELWLKVKVL